jgi:CpXC protein
MSLFENVTLPCPACGEHVEFEAVSSVNADRRPDLRDEILNGTFQSQACSKCQVPFRLDPQMTYLDVGRGQWIIVHPFGSIGDWEALEARARAAYDRSYGAAAPPAARKLGAGLQPRLVFGWAALREKLFAAEHGLNDIDLELTKIAVLRGSVASPVTAETELRLVDIRGDEMIMTWLVAETGEVAQTLAVPRELCDEIAADRTGWQPLREELTGRFVVDMQQLMLPVA